jgi:hypothetical protein
MTLAFFSSHLKVWHLAEKKITLKVLQDSNQWIFVVTEKEKEYTIPLKEVKGIPSEIMTNKPALMRFFEDTYMTANPTSQGYQLYVNQKLKGGGNIIEADTESSRLWPGAIIPYVISNHFPANVSGDQRRQAILDAIALWNRNTHFTLRERNGERDYIEFREYTGKCHARVGRLKEQNLIECDLDGSHKGNLRRMTRHVAHEIGHKLGFRHEHQRSDRNSYVTVTQGTMSDDDFKLAYGDTSKQENRFGNYDFRSIMHYYLYSPSVPAPIKNPNLTYKAGLPQGTNITDVGNMLEISDSDREAANYLAQKSQEHYVGLLLSIKISVTESDVGEPDRNSDVFHFKCLMQKGTAPWSLPERSVCASEARTVFNGVQFVFDDNGNIRIFGGQIFVYEYTGDSCGYGDNEPDATATFPEMRLNANTYELKESERATSTGAGGGDYGDVTITAQRFNDVSNFLGEEGVYRSEAVSDAVEELPCCNYSSTVCRM